MWTVLLVALMVPVQDTKDELKKLEGSWRMDKAELNGAEMPRELTQTFTLTLKGDKYELISGGPKDEGTVTVDPAQKPKTMRIKGTSGPNQGKTLLAIYEISDGLLRVCYDLEGKEYPKEFSAPAGTKRFYVVYKPAKP